MIIVFPTITSFDSIISILPRYYDDLDINDLDIIIKDEDTRKELSLIITDKVKADGFFGFNVQAAFKENSTYNLKVNDSTSGLVYFRGKLFCTNQSTQNYSING